MWHFWLTECLWICQPIRLRLLSRSLQAGFHSRPQSVIHDKHYDGEGVGEADVAEEEWEYDDEEADDDGVEYECFDDGIDRGSGWCVWSGVWSGVK